VVGCLGVSFVHLAFRATTTTTTNPTQLNQAHIGAPMCSNGSEEDWLDHRCTYDEPTVALSFAGSRSSPQGLRGVGATCVVPSSLIATNFQ
jgi:hypothetical protein